MDASILPKGQSPEVTEGKQNLPGIYRHKETGNEVITAEGNEGVIMADAMMSPVWKDQWERIGDVPSRSEILKMQKAQAAKEVKTEGNPKVKAELEAFAN